MYRSLLQSPDPYLPPLHCNTMTYNRTHKTRLNKARVDFLQKKAQTTQWRRLVLHKVPIIFPNWNKNVPAGRDLRNGQNQEKMRRACFQHATESKRHRVLFWWSVAQYVMLKGRRSSSRVIIQKIMEKIHGTRKNPRTRTLR